MHFSLLGHATIWIEHGSTAVLVDPWLEGTCYDDAWALLPDRPEVVPRLRRPQWLIYTHQHPDHLHVPTLLALRARWGPLSILIPRQALPRMAEALARLRVGDVREVPLGRAFPLSEDLTVTLHAARADDCVQVFRGGSRTLVNANDCVLEGRLLADLVRRAPAPDFYFGQFSAGDGYPWRLEGLTPAEAEAARGDLIQRFRAQAAAFRAQHAVPLGSFVRFAHVDNVAMNRHAVTLSDLAAALATEASLAVLYPGDGWSDEGGFLRRAEHREAYEKALAEVTAGVASLARREPVPPRADIEVAAQRFFERAFNRLSARWRRALGRLGFHLDDAGRGLIVDWPERRLTWCEGAPPEPFYRLGAGLFVSACRSPWGWSNVHIGCRFTMHGWRDNRAVQAFLPISILYGLGYFDRPLLAHLRPRVLGVAWRRRAELSDFAGRFFSGQLWQPGAFSRL